jgi:hypothetical protein
MKTTEEHSFENHLDHLGEHLRWSPAWAGKIVRRAQATGLVQVRG